MPSAKQEVARSTNVLLKFCRGVPRELKLALVYTPEMRLPVCLRRDANNSISLSLPKKVL